MHYCTLSLVESLRVSLRYNAIPSSSNWESPEPIQTYQMPSDNKSIPLLVNVTDDRGVSLLTEVPNINNFPDTTYKPSHSEDAEPRGIGRIALITTLELVLVTCWVLTGEIAQVWLAWWCHL